MKKLLLLALLLLFASCQRKVSTPVPGPIEPASTAQDIVPEEPIQRLTWEAAHRVHAAIESHLAPPSFQLGDISNELSWPAEADSYFLNAFQKRLLEMQMQISKSSDVILTGKLFGRNGEVVFAFTFSRNRTALYSDSASVPEDARLQNTFVQFDQHMHAHKEMKVPTPLAELAEAPLDILPDCKQNDCFLLLLFTDRLEKLDWRTSEKKSLPFSSRFLASMRSRAPSGKIVHFGDGYIVMHNNLASPLYFTGDLSGPPGVFTDRPDWLPLPEPTVNSFALRDGHFFDFELLPDRKFAVIDTNQKLSVAESGKLISSDAEVGGTLCAALPVLYASSPSLPGKADAVLKFSYQSDSLHLESTRLADGEVLDLAISDLNQDQERELLVTVRNSRGIFIEVMEPF